MRFILIILLLLLTLPISVEAGHRFPINQDFPTTFIQINVVNENEEFIPSLVHVRSFYENILIDDYSLTISEPNQNLTVPWSKLFRGIGTEVELIASSEGYKNSDSYLFTITEDTPTDGILFQNTFVLTQLGSTSTVEINELTETVQYLDSNFDISMSTTSEIQEFTFDPDITSIIVDLDESNPKGFLNVTVPKLLFGGPFRVVVDGFLGSSTRYDNGDSFTLQIDYLSGSHEIIIKSQTIFQVDEPDPILTLDILDGDFKSGDTLSFTGTLLPIQPQSEIILTFTDSQDNVIIRNFDVLSDGSFEYNINLELVGRWNVFATYEFEGKIIKSNIIIFSIAPTDEPVVIEPEPEEAEEPEEVEEPEDADKSIVNEESDEVEDESGAEEEISEQTSDFNTTVLILVIVVAVAAGLIFFKKDLILSKLNSSKKD